MKKSEQKGLFLQRLGELLQKGYSLTEAFDLIFLHQTKSSTLIKAFLTKKLQAGESLANVLLELGIPSTVCIQIYLAEHHGMMPQTLIQSGKYLIKKKKDREVLMKTVQYPLILLTVLIFLLVLLRKNLFPRFETLYASLNYSPSSNIQLLFSIIDVLPQFVIAVICLFLLLLLIWKIATKYLSAILMTSVLARIPFLSGVIQFAHTHFFSREMSYLLRNGVSILDCLKLLKEQQYRPLLREIADVIMRKLREGQSFHECLTTYSFLRKELSHVVHHGQANGKLADELEYYSAVCLEELEKYTMRQMKWIQPTVFVIIGGFVLAVYFSIMMPLFQMMQSLT